MLLNVSAQEAREIAKVQMKVEEKYVGRVADLATYSSYASELKEELEKIGFVCEVAPRIENGTWFLACSITGHVDSRRDRYAEEQGIDVERMHWEANRVTSDELASEGVETGLL